jgi:hypothetical protein
VSRAHLLAGKRDPWTPWVIPRSQLLAWWDAEQVSTISESSGAVTEWRDLMRGYAPTASTTARPTYDATGFNGRPVLTFDGVANCLTLTGVPTGLPTGASPCELWALVDQTSLATGNNRVVFGWGDGSAAGVSNRFMSKTVSSSANRARVGSGNGTVLTASVEATMDFTGRHVVRAVIDGTNIRIEIDGVASVKAAAAPVTATTRFRIGSFFAASASGFFGGGMNSLLVTTMLDDTVAARLRAYLDARK